MRIYVNIKYHCEKYDKINKLHINMYTYYTDT